jgi:hypothetical protein
VDQGGNVTARHEKSDGDKCTGMEARGQIASVRGRTFRMTPAIKQVPAD